MDPRDDSTAKKKVSGIFLSSFSVIIQSEPVTIKQNESVLGYAVANIIGKQPDKLQRKHP